jgi:alpha-1,3-rhamnosyl/mannosyltransferase
MASALVMPSLYEGFGLPVVEAMAAGCPVITSNGGALPEVAGDAAEIVDPEDVDALSDAMERVLLEPSVARELREKGRVRARAFDWTTTARRVLEIFERIGAIGSTGAVSCCMAMLLTRPLKRPWRPAGQSRTAGASPFASA